MTVRVFIDGEAGTTGLEIRELLANHPGVELLHIDQLERKDDRARRRLLQGADVAILCLPDAAARSAVALIGDAGTRVIDASTAHRTDPGWTYGLPELTGQRERIRHARLVSNPGCYPQGVVLFLQPLIAAGLVPADLPVSVHAVSGYSGGGRALIERFDAAGTHRDGLTVRPYALGLAHKHVPEMQHYSGLEHAPLFAPSVADFYKGMLVHVPLILERLPGAPTPGDVLDVLASTYRGERFLKLHPLGAPDEIVDGYLSATTCNGTNRMDMMLFGNDAQVLLTARLDNLGKGAAGSAVQSLNLMCGFDEQEGLAP